MPVRMEVPARQHRPGLWGPQTLHPARIVGPDRALEVMTVGMSRPAVSQARLAVMLLKWPDHLLIIHQEVAVPPQTDDKADHSAVYSGGRLR